MRPVRTSFHIMAGLTESRAAARRTSSRRRVVSGGGARVVMWRRQLGVPEDEPDANLHPVLPVTSLTAREVPTTRPTVVHPDRSGACPCPGYVFRPAARDQWSPAGSRRTW